MCLRTTVILGILNHVVFGSLKCRNAIYRTSVEILLHSSSEKLSYLYTKFKEKISDINGIIYNLINVLADLDGEKHCSIFPNYVATLVMKGNGQTVWY